jgi:hypothetical protein
MDKEMMIIPVKKPSRKRIGSLFKNWILKQLKAESSNVGYDVLEWILSTDLKKKGKCKKLRQMKLYPREKKNTEC